MNRTSRPPDLRRLMQRITEAWHSSSLWEKWHEALTGVLPVSVLVLLISFFAAPIPTDAWAGFLLATALLVFGMGMFSLGTDMAMTPIGQAIGQEATRSRRLWVVLATGFAVGLLVTVAEPDLTVLAGQVRSIPALAMIGSVALGVGLFLMLALLRILYRVPIRLLLLAGYALVFGLAFLVPRGFLAVSFDAGGVTTGPMTVPFILGLGVGVSSVRSDRGAENDSFGLVALSSVGPVIAVMLLGIVFHAEDSETTVISLTEAADSGLLFRAFWDALPHYLGEVGIALAPVAALFLVFQFTSLHLRGAPLRRIILGLIYTYAGLTVFLLGVNIGFMPVGYAIGGRLAAGRLPWLLIPLGMAIGWFVVSAEPAVQVLDQQVYEITAGAVPRRALLLSLQGGVAVSVGLALLRVLTRIPVLYLLMPGYALALLLMLFSPPVFTSIAFDSGGVASGPMTATFLLPLAMGACQALGGNAAADAFGVVAMVAMTPLIAIQALGILFRIKQRRGGETAAPAAEEIIEL